MDAHFEDDPEFRVWPRHCVAGTIGQQKAEATLLEKRVVIPNRECELAIEGAQQIVLEKQTVDVFLSRNLKRVMEQLGAGHFVVYGVVTEICVLHVARGLSRLGNRVSVVTDASKALDVAHSERALAEIRGAGGILTTAAEVTA